MKILLFIHQLPQNIIALLLFFYVSLVDPKVLVTSENIVVTDSIPAGVSLGNFIFVKTNYSIDTIKHEKGHQKQSLRLGWLYLLVVGLPSITRNIWDRLFHNNWSYKKRINWYYSHFPELQADRFGGVERNGY